MEKFYFYQECIIMENRIKKDNSITERKENLKEFLELQKSGSLLDDIIFVAKTSISHVNNIGNILLNYNSIEGVKRKLESNFKDAFYYYHLTEGFLRYDLKSWLNKKNKSYNYFDALMSDFLQEFYHFSDIVKLIENYDKNKYLEYLQNQGVYNTIKKTKKDILQAVLYEFYLNNYDIELLEV